MSLEVNVYCNGEVVSDKWLSLSSEEINGLVRDIVFEGARRIVELAKAKCPVKTGRLRDSIQAIEHGDGTVVLATAPYASPVEFGHVTASGSFVPAVLFLTESANQVIPEVAKRIEERVNDYIRMKGEAAFNPNLYGVK